MTRHRLPEAPPRAAAPKAFTLVELLAVIAVIGILASILIPTAGVVRVMAKRTETKARFAQWTVAMELFRQEYGYYPAIATDGKIDAARFAPALTGRLNLAGDEIAASAPASALGGNVRRLAFCAVSEGELDATRSALVDAFGNSDIAVRVDLNGDGRIDELDAGNGYPGFWPSVTGGGAALSPADADETIQSGSLRAGVAFYSAGSGDGPAAMVLSWK